MKSHFGVKTIRFYDSMNSPKFEVWQRAGCFAWFVFLMSRGDCVANPRGAMGLSAVCDCGIS